MSKASEKALGKLHEAIVIALTDIVSEQAEDTVFDADGNEVGTGKMRYVASPAYIAAAVKLLKDNQITCDIEVDTNMNNLRESLANKQRHSRLKDAGEAALELVG